MGDGKSGENVDEVMLAEIDNGETGEHHVGPAQHTVCDVYF
ncbi:MAG TPA: hypothetical protein VE196_02425 [Pseudonocardiaceae bacterium]|nr:hypothetical protein [Pseudonocardiaceae bacterium]